MSDSDDSVDVPPREVCEQRCQEFASVTGTDSALAMFYLQDRDWDLSRALNAFFEEHSSVTNKPAGGASQANSGPGGNGLGASAKTIDLTDSPSQHQDMQEAADPQPHRLRLMTWNIDGLDTNNLATRTKGICNTITQEDPHVVYLQEVVPKSLEILEEQCPLYQIIPAGNQGYFTAIMLKCDAVQYEDHKITQFYSSVMSRNLLKVKAKVKGVAYLLMTSHLESTKNHGAERKKQLQAAFKEMHSAEPERTVVFGGDLNLRDKEVQEIGGLPEAVLDLWEVTGKRPEAKFTWDSARNDNLNTPFPCKCRFDRLYLRHSVPRRRVKPVYFELVGLERLPGCRRFCSDHWGILTHFDKV